MNRDPVTEAATPVGDVGFEATYASHSDLLGMRVSSAIWVLRRSTQLLRYRRDGKVAVDAVSLAIDERLRTAYAFGCLRCIPQLSVVPAQALVIGIPIGWALLVCPGGMAVVYGLWLWATASQRQSTPLPLTPGPVGGWPFVPGAGS